MCEIYRVCLVSVNFGLFVQNDEDPVLEGEKEAEKMIVEAYSALLIAFLSTERLVDYFILFS